MLYVGGVVIELDDGFMFVEGIGLIVYLVMYVKEILL